MTRRLRILLVEDEESILRGLVREFEHQGYQVDFSWNGTDGLQKALQSEYDLLLLDIMLPGKSGLEVCTEVRRRKPAQAIILLTAKSAREEVIAGLRAGADDYIAKPFSLTELSLRIEALLRRSTSRPSQARHLTLANGFSLDTLSLQGQAMSGGAPVIFTRKEADLLRYLAGNTDRPVSKFELLREVWGYMRSRVLDTRTVDVHVARVRRKIGDTGADAEVLVTIRREGYRLRVADTGLEEATDGTAHAGRER